MVNKAAERQIGSDDHQRQSGSDSPEIGGVAGDHGLPGSLRANNDMGIDNVTLSPAQRAAFQKADADRFFFALTLSGALDRTRPSDR
jgi:hypothetical protein